MSTSAHNVLADPVALLQRHGEQVERFLAAFLGRQGQTPPRLAESIAYSLTAGGKRLRPGLILESAMACGGFIDDTALAAAGAIELVHTFSLVHDDLPAMDNDDLRRGRPTNHKVFGEAMAILAGDAMVTLAFEMIAAHANHHAAMRLIVELAQASGPQGMIGGQVLDMQGEGHALTLAQLQELHRKKTGALLRAACRMGAIAVGADEGKLAALTAYGEHMGLAFQIVDDVLDVTSTPQEMGKATGKDAAKGKNTYPALLGLEASKARARDELAAAIAALGPLGPAGQGLAALARFIVERRH